MKRINLKFIVWIFICFVLLLPIASNNVRKSLFEDQPKFLHINLMTNKSSSEIQVFRMPYSGSSISLAKANFHEWIVTGFYSKALILKIPKEDSLKKVVFYIGNLELPFAGKLSQWQRFSDCNFTIYKANRFLRLQLAMSLFLPIFISFLKFVYLGIIAATIIGIPISRFYRRVDSMPSYLHIVIVFFVTILIGYMGAIRGIDYLHQGVMLHTAYDMLRGLVPYKDTFLQYGLLTSVLQEIAIKLFGVSVIVINMQTVFFYGLIGVGLWFLWGTILSRGLTTISILGWLFCSPYMLKGYTFHPWSSVYAILFQIWGAVFFLNYYRSSKHYWLIASAIFVALVYWCRQPTGIFLTVGFILLSLIILFKSQKKVKKIDLAVFFASQALIHLSFLFWIYSHHAINDYIKQSWLMAAIWAKDMGGSGNPLVIISSLFPLFKKGLSFDMWIWLLLPFNALILFVYFIIKSGIKQKLSEKQMIVVIISIICLTSWSQYYTVTCFRHVFWAATPMFGLFMYSVLILFQKRSRKNIEFSIFIFVFMLGNSVIVRGFNFYEKVFEHRSEILSPRIVSGLLLSKEEYAMLSSITYSIDKYHKIFPGKQVYSLKNPLILLLSLPKTPNFHSMYLDYDNLNSGVYPDYEIIFQRYLNRYKPFIIGKNKQIDHYRIVEQIQVPNNDDLYIQLHDDDILRFNSLFDLNLERKLK